MTQASGILCCFLLYRFTVNVFFERNRMYELSMGSKESKTVVTFGATILEIATRFGRAEIQKCRFEMHKADGSCTFVALENIKVKF